MKPIVIIESPYAGDIERNVAYARACMRDSLLRGEAPYASHLLYTQPGVLRDEVPEERELGMTAGFEFRRCADIVAFYVDLGISRGMQRQLDHIRARLEALGRSVFDVDPLTGAPPERRLIHQMRSLPEWAARLPRDEVVDYVTGLTAYQAAGLKPVKP